MAQTITDIDVNESHLLDTLSAIVAWALAGWASLTLYNARTGVRFTFTVKVTRSRTEAGGHKANHGRGPWEVAVRRGLPGGGWANVGCGQMRRFNHGRLGQRLVFAHNPEGEGFDFHSPEIQAFHWLVRRINDGLELPSCVKVWRGDNCGRCGAELTSEFRLIGYGPECCKHMGVDAKVVLAITDERGRLEAVRDMAHRHARGLQDQLFLRLLPSGSIARDYAAGHGLVSAA